MNTVTTSGDPLALLQSYPDQTEGDRRDLDAYRAWMLTGNYEEAAARLGCTDKTVRARCRRVREWLAREMRTGAEMRAAFGGSVSGGAAH